MEFLGERTGRLDSVMYFSFRKIHSNPGLYIWTLLCTAAEGVTE